MKNSDNSLRIPLIVALLVSVLMGFTAGVVGELWVNNFLAPDLEFKSYRDLTKRIDDLLNEKNLGVKDILTDHDAAFERTIEEIAPVTATFYAYKDIGLSLANVYLADDVLGSGFVLTSDGWLLTTTAVLPNPKMPYAVRVGDRVYRVEEIIADSMTPAVLVKVEANNLPVANLGSKNSIYSSQSLLVASDVRGMKRINVSKLNYAEGTDVSELVHSSENYYKFIQLDDDFTSEYIGAPVVNLDGKVVALLLSETGSALPIDYLIRVMKSAVQSGEINRILLGVNYLDLSQTVNFETELRNGAWLTAVGGRRAVMPGTPAAASGLQSGDVILKVDADDITEQRSLTELIQEYNQGTEVTLTVRREGQDIKIPVVLTELKSN
ncbi:TPA: hypothetical protein DF272_05615 [Candidatus Falkowbacteria bacterium]|nr:hypothetical protein [Candidatus Falkowbacteria bacterium]